MNIPIDKIHEMMSLQDQIRNFSIIAHVDHGKTTLSDSLIAKAGIIAQKKAGAACYMDTDPLEQQKGITIKSTSISLIFQNTSQEENVCEKNEGERDDSHLTQDQSIFNPKNTFLLNMIDCPGHVDFSSEVTSALRVTDGALVVVDAVEGACVQTETVLRQAMQEKVRPVLIVNKVDRLILELKSDPESIYQNFVKVIDQVNVVISNYEQEDMGDLYLDPVKGNVAFGAGKDCWAFTLKTFARCYAKKFKIKEDVLMSKFWGDNYYDEKTKKWTTEDKDASGKTLSRGFNTFILQPIIKLVSSIMEGNNEQLEKLLSSLEIKLKKEEREQKGKELLKTIMSRWINAADTLLDMIVCHLPSPKEAQKYKAAYLYEGPFDDECARSIRECDPNGPLMMFVSKMVPNSDQSRFYAFGRVFSGTVKAGKTVKILGPNFIPGRKDSLFEKKISRIVVLMGRSVESISEAQCGNIIALVGIDNELSKTGTITDHPSAHTIRNMKYSVSPVVKVAVEPKNMADLPKLIEGLIKLSKSDSIVQCSKIESTGQHVISASGELHIETCLYDLLNKYTHNLEIVKSEPIVSYKETVLKKSEFACMVKTANNHNRLYAEAEPLGEQLCIAIESGLITNQTDPKVRANLLTTEFSWQKDMPMKLWSFCGPNALLNLSSGIQYMNEIQDSMTTSFQHFTSEGVLAEEETRGIRFNILDAKLHSDSIHRGQQIIYFFCLLIFTVAILIILFIYFLFVYCSF